MDGVLKRDRSVSTIDYRVINTDIIVQVHCADVTRGGLLPDTRCQHLTRPESEAFCDAGPCISDTWLIGQWGMVRWQIFLVRMVVNIFCFSAVPRVAKARCTER